MIHAIILAGGWGRRLWPKSRRDSPKQLLSFNKKPSSLQNLFNIIKSEIPKERILVVTNKKYALNLRKQLPALAKRNFLVEPLSRNTAAAVGFASLVIKKKDPQAVILVLFSDHILRQKRPFLKTIKAACMFAKERDALVTIGIRPSRPTVEYGYIKIGTSSKPKGKRPRICKVERFVEKPKIERAKAYLKTKRYLWNSGIFACQLTSIHKAIKSYLPNLYSGLQRIEKTLGSPQYKDRLVKEYKKFEDISITYGIMEKAKNVYTVVGDFPWEDLGTWVSFSLGLFSCDRQGNIIQALHKGLDTRNSIILTEDKHLIATLDVHDLIIVHTPSITLVCKKDKARELKKLTEVLEKDKSFRKYL